MITFLIAENYNNKPVLSKGLRLENNGQLDRKKRFQTGWIQL